MSETVETMKLVEAACEAAQRAYAPYSRFQVGAAILTGSGRIVRACNVENGSYGLTICAERAAVFKAISEGERELVAMAVSVPGGGMPCGACRQVLHEFNPKMMVVVADERKNIISKHYLYDLLPEPFGGPERTKESGSEEDRSQPR